MNYGAPLNDMLCILNMHCVHDLLLILDSQRANKFTIGELDAVPSSQLTKARSSN